MKTLDLEYYKGIIKEQSKVQEQVNDMSIGVLKASMAITKEHIDELEEAITSSKFQREKKLSEEYREELANIFYFAIRKFMGEEEDVEVITRLSPRVFQVSFAKAGDKAGFYSDISISIESDRVYTDQFLKITYGGVNFYPNEDRYHYMKYKFHALSYIASNLSELEEIFVKYISDLEDVGEDLSQFNTVKRMLDDVYEDMKKRYSVLETQTFLDNMVVGKFYMLKAYGIAQFKGYSKSGKSANFTTYNNNKTYNRRLDKVKLYNSIDHEATRKLETLNVGDSVIQLGKIQKIELPRLNIRGENSMISSYIVDSMILSNIK